MNTINIQQPTMIQRLASLLPLLVVAMVLGAFATPAEAQRARTRTPPPQQQTDDPETTKVDPEIKPGDPATPPPAEARPSQVQPSQPTPQVEAEPKPVLKPTPFLTTRNPKLWNLRTEVVIRRVESLQPRGNQQELVVVPMDFTSATIVFPVLPTSSSHRMEMREVDGVAIPDFTGQVTLNDRPVPQDMSFIQRGADGKPLPSNTWRAQWFVAQPSGAGFRDVREMNLRFEVPVESFETEFNEQAATRVPWPDGPWPEEALAALQPEAYIEYDPANRNAVHSTEEIDRLLGVWLEGNDPRKLPPVTLAKWLAGKVVEHVQPSGDGLAFDQRTQMFTGFNLQSVPVTAVSGRGSPFDMNNLLVAVYRRAGLPARVVIGFDTASARSGRTIYERSRNRPNLRVWTEFCLYDAQNQTLGWIPVDVVEMRASSNRLPPRFLERPQKYFGSHDDLDDVIPLAHHYAPAQTSVWFYDFPAFWGWFVQPAPPNVGSQTVRFDASRASRRSNR